MVAAAAGEQVLSIATMVKILLQVVAVLAAFICILNNKFNSLKGI
jgi:hypothetical protein